MYLYRIIPNNVIIPKVVPTRQELDIRKNKLHYRTIRKKQKRQKCLTSRKRRRKISSSSQKTKELVTSSLAVTVRAAPSNQKTDLPNTSQKSQPVMVELNLEQETPSGPGCNRKGIKSWLDQRRMRETISFIFEFTYYPEYFKGNQDIYGRGGIISCIANTLKMGNTHYKTVKKVVLDTLNAIENDEIYEPFRDTYDNQASHKVQPTSLDMHHIASMKENGSFRYTAQMFNALVRAPAGLPPIGYTAIYNAVKRSNHVVVKTEKVHQASDNNKAWVKARFQANSQLLVRFGMEYPSETSGMKVQDPMYISKEAIDKNNLNLTIHQVAWWDEKHIKQVVGDFRDHSYQFGFDENGKYDAKIEIELVRRVSLYFYYRM